MVVVVGHSFERRNSKKEKKGKEGGTKDERLTRGIKNTTKWNVYVRVCV